MKHLKPLRSALNLIKGQSPYFIRYKVINHRETSNNVRLSSWDSEMYGYVVYSKSENEARDEFMRLWSDETSGCFPHPDIKISSIKKIDSNDPNLTPGNFMGVKNSENKIFLY